MSSKSQWASIIALYVKLGPSEIRSCFTYCKKLKPTFKNHVFYKIHFNVLEDKGVAWAPCLKTHNKPVQSALVYITSI